MPIEAGSLHYAVGPFIAVTVVILLGLFMRWAFGTGYGRRPPSAAADDEGLLTPVATLSRRESALALRAVLSDAGIRSTVRFPAAHRADVLVFREDADRARAIATTFADGY
ncbi:MAG: hypothetical protein JF630_10875 [Geodermatophilales bacterium]|nr:hypothetical protein [Geodermatophilales bacterium]